MRLCVACGSEKEEREFYQRKQGKNRRCKPCHEARRREVDPYLNIKASLGQRRRDALRRGLPFAITLANLLPLPDSCPVLGIPLFVGPSGGGDNSPSIDRIIPAEGYVPGNVIVVSLKANRIKNDATVDELRKVVEFYERIT